MKNIIFSLWFLFIATISSCSQNSSTAKRQDYLLGFIKKEIFLDSTIVFYPGEKEKSISIHFYNLKEKNYFYIYPVSGYWAQYLKGWYTTDSLTLFYHGIDDDLAKDYIDLIYPDLDILEKEYFNLDHTTIDIPDSEVKFYQIINDSVFKRFVPDLTHKSELEKLLYKVGYFSEPPPPPVEN